MARVRSASISEWLTPMKYTFTICLALLTLVAGAAEIPCRPDGGQWPPVIGAWFWTQKDLEPEGYKLFLGAAAGRSPYTLLSTACRRIEVVDPLFRRQADKAVRYAGTRGLKVAMSTAWRADCGGVRGIVGHAVRRCRRRAQAGAAQGDQLFYFPASNSTFPVWPLLAVGAGSTETRIAVSGALPEEREVMCAPSAHPQQRPQVVHHRLEHPGRRPATAGSAGRRRHGGRSLGIIRHACPPRTTYRGPVNSSRSGCSRCGASSRIRVRCGATNHHPSSVTSPG